VSHLGEIHLHKAEAAADEGNLARARELYDKAIRAYAGDDPAGAVARVGLAVVYLELDQLDDAWAMLSQAEPVLGGGDDPALHARSLNHMGAVQRRRGELDEAAELHGRARGVAVVAGDLRQQAVALRNLAGVERARGALTKAASLLEESAQLQAAEGDRRAVALVWRQVRAVELEAGRVRRAHAAALREVEERRALGEGAAIAATLHEAADLAQLLDRWEEASAWLSESAELRAQAGDMEGAGRALLDAGLALLAAGHPAGARRKLEAARDALGERGGSIDVRARLWAAFAETDLARLEAERFGESDPLLLLRGEAAPDAALAEQPQADAQLRRRAHEQAEEALALAQQSSRPALRAAAHDLRARSLALRGEHEPARDAFRGAVELLEDVREPAHAPRVRYQVFLGFGRWLVRGDGASAGAGADARAGRDYLERAAVCAEEALSAGVSADPAARARAALALHAHRAGDKDGAQAQLERARAHLGPPVEEPTSPRAHLRSLVERLGRRLEVDPVGSDRLLRDAEAAAQGHLDRLTPDRLQGALYDLRRVQEIGKALNSSLELEQLLGLIIDVAVDLMGAERGFLILTEGETVAFKVARNIERAEVERPDRKVSNTIARQAIEGNAPVVTGDAARDDRFAGTSSVVEQRLRSVAAVPLRVKGQVTGAIYLDHRYKGDLFDPLSVELLEGLADQAAIALENARLVREGRSRAAALAAEAARLQGQVASQTREIEVIRKRLEARTLEEGARYRYENIIGASAAMERVFRLLDKVAGSDIAVFIHGESGTGKELIARAIHHNSRRASGPFVSENFAAIVDELLESELFGHVKGSFTGAIHDKQGLFERANGGTIFLDEVGDLSDKMQKELLRVLEEGEVRPVGGDAPIPVDVRLISATHQDLKKLVAEGRFRQDLFYRLHVLAVELPPLRDRQGDVPLLAERFLGEFARGQGEEPKRISADAMAKLVGYTWPGNVRELRNLIDRTALLCRGDEIQAGDVVFDGDGGGREQDLSQLDWSEAKEAFAARYLRSVLARVGGNVSLAARESGMLRQAFQRLVKRHGVDPNEFRPPRS
jgi:transcriptional regulator with GAF, ATPase, and Fis domain/predicted negative regulator of RcsB-dependent stress response